MDSKAPPSVTITSTDGVVPVLDAAAAASARRYTTTFCNNTFVADWQSDYNGRIEVSELNAAFSEMTEMATKRQKVYRSLVILLFVYVGIAITLNLIGVAVFMTTDSLAGLFSLVGVGSALTCVGLVIYSIRMVRHLREFRAAISDYCDGLTRRYAGRGLYWSYDFDPGSKHHPGHFCIVIRVVPVPGLPFTSHPHVTVMPTAMYQNAAPVYATPGFQNAPPVHQQVYAAPVYQQVVSLPSGAVAINFDDRGNLENAPLLRSQQ